MSLALLLLFRVPLLYAYILFSAALIIFMSGKEQEVILKYSYVEGETAVAKLSSRENRPYAD